VPREIPLAARSHWFFGNTLVKAGHLMRLLCRPIQNDSGLPQGRGCFRGETPRFHHPARQHGRRRRGGEPEVLARWRRNRWLPQTTCADCGGSFWRRRHQARRPPPAKIRPELGQRDYRA